MNKNIVAVLVSVVLGLTACKTGTSSSSDGVDITSGIGIVSDCGKAAIAEVAKTHLTEVETVLLVDDWKTQLISIASNIGEEALSCIIDSIIGRSSIDVKASGDPNEKLKVDRGKQWLAARKVQFLPASRSGK